MTRFHISLSREKQMPQPQQIGPARPARRPVVKPLPVCAGLFGERA